MWLFLFMCWSKISENQHSRLQYFGENITDNVSNRKAVKLSWRWWINDNIHFARRQKFALKSNNEKALPFEKKVSCFVVISFFCFIYIYGARWMDYIHSLKLKIVFPSCCSLAGNKKIDDVKSILKSLLEFIPMMSDRWIVDTHCNVSKSYPIFWHRKHILSDITTPEMAIINRTQLTIYHKTI